MIGPKTAGQPYVVGRVHINAKEMMEYINPIQAVISRRFLNNSKFSLRRASGEDIDFIFQVRAQSMKNDFTRTSGWNDDDQYKRAADEIGQAQIIMAGKEPVGFIKVLTREHELHLHQMQILPRYQGFGIGTALVQCVLDRADSQNLPVTLFVLKGARSRNLYDRMGFSVIEENIYNFKMCRIPDSGKRSDEAL